MKTKLLNKKLGFKKETISNLENRQMDEARGGGIAPPTYYKPLCVTVSICFPTCGYTDCGATCGATCCTSIDACSC